MPGPVPRLTIALAATALLAACGGSTEAGDGGRGPSEPGAGYPVTIENCGREITFESAPERVVSLWQAPTEMLLALGLDDRITAMAGSYGPFPESIAKRAEQVPSIGSPTSWPSREALLSEEPDLVVGQSLEGFAFSTEQGLASVEQIEDSGANVYGASMCGMADLPRMTIDTPVKTLRDLGTIFGVSDRAEEIIASLEQQKQAVVDAVKGKPDVKVAFFNGGTGPINVLAGGKHDSAISTAGGTNVFPTGSAQVSKEEFADSGAEVVLVGTFEGQDFQTQRDYLRTTFPDLPAVESDRIYEVPVAETDATISVMRGLTKIANALHPGLDLAVPAS